MENIDTNSLFNVTKNLNLAKKQTDSQNKNTVLDIIMLVYFINIIVGETFWLVF